jgi:putative endonuclease
MILTLKRNIGNLGEKIAVKHLVKHSFEILERNYRKKWGEIDIIAKKDDILHFIEVKSVSCETKKKEFQPQENVHFWKQRKLARAIKTYLSEKKVSDETEWQIDIITVFLNFETRRAKIKTIENVILA